MKNTIANQVARVTNSVLNTLLGDGIVVAVDHVRKIRHSAV